MPLQAGTKLGPYEVVALIGAGGMGEVYRATDTRLDRTVAIKVLPQETAENADLRQRFEREARTISALNHPHICVLHDVGHQDGTDFLVMEYLEGESLAQRLAKGPIALDECLEYAMQIADALDKAHRQGVVHRDLKPGNIMITKSGTKLLDFGLAKLRQPEGQSPLGTQSRMPTRGNEHLTVDGTILGTVQYMSPEQLEGQEADARSDIFAFGAVLYEMVTGRKAFQGKSTVSLMAAILEHDPPPMTSLHRLTPPMLDYVVRTCLAKNPDKRWQTASDLTLQLRWIVESPESVAVPAVAKNRWRERLAWIVALVAVATALLLASALRKDPPESEPMVFEVATPLTTSGNQFALSPDGRYLVSNVNSTSASVLWLRTMEHLNDRILKDTDNGQDPFWSPDSRFVGFFADGKLKKVDIAGAPPQTLSDSVAAGGSWSADGTIIFAKDAAGPIYKIAAAGGGTPVAVTELDASRAEALHARPYFLPDGKRFIYLSVSTKPENTGIFLASTESKERKFLVNSAVAPAFAPPNYLLFMRDETLLVQLVDLETFEPIGEARPVADGVGFFISAGRAGFSISRNGMLAFRTGTGSIRQLWTANRSGSASPELQHDTNYVAPAFSPNGRQIIGELREASNPGDLWLIETGRKTSQRFTFHEARDASPVWSPDGQQIVFTSDRDGGVFNLYLKSAGGARPEELLLKTDLSKAPLQWSADGKYILFIQNDPKTRQDIWALPMFGDRKPVPVIQTPFVENGARLSPDSRWIAYQSDESGNLEIYVQTFPPSANKWKISTNGGQTPRWRADGKEIFFDTPGGAAGLMTVQVTSQKYPTDFQVSVPQIAFSNIVIAGLYDVSADGQRIVLDGRVASAQELNHLTLILNWPATIASKK